MNPFQTRTPIRACLALLVASMTFACQPGDEGDSDPTASAPDGWPGGSLGAWENGDGVEESWDRDHAGSSSDGEGRGGMGSAADAGAAWADEEYGGAGGGAGSSGDPGEHGEPMPGYEDPPPAAALEGGEIDDNAHFEAFLTYAAETRDARGGDPMIHWLDVTVRHLIRAVDADGATVPDADVRVLVDGEPVAAGRTRADGRFAFFPRAYGLDADRFTVEVATAYGQGQAELGADDETLDIALDAARPADPVFRLDVAFVIDATGSMSEEIDRIKTTLTDIASRISDSGYAPDLRFALVDYRDRGDDYVTHAVNFTRDVAAFQRSIDRVTADGGGDGPEALNAALRDAMRRLEWRSEPTLRMAFIVADAPAHAYEQESYTYDEAMLDAAVMGVKLFPIASGGSDPIAELQFRQMAQFTLAHFIFITEGGGSSAGSGGSDYDVDPDQFRVERLDDLLVRLVDEEAAAWHGAPVAPPADDVRPQR